MSLDQLFPSPRGDKLQPAVDQLHALEGMVSVPSRG